MVKAYGRNDNGMETGKIGKKHKRGRIEGEYRRNFVH